MVFQNCIFLIRKVRRSFPTVICPRFRMAHAWGSIEKTIIGMTHSTLHSKFWNTSPCNEKTLIDDACSELLFEESDFIESESESADR